MILGMAVWAFTLDIPVRQKHLFYRVKELLDRAFLNQTLCFSPPVDIVAKFLILWRIGGVVAVEVDIKPVKIGFMFFPYAIYQLSGRDAFLFRAEHDRGAVSVVRTDIVHLVFLHFLKAHPDVGLDVFHQVPQMDAAIRIGKC